MTHVRRRGFSLIEILVVIGIILILVGIATMGITYVTKAGKNNSVKVTLNNLRGMVTELEAKSGLNGRQPPFMWYDATAATITPTQTTAGAALDFWKDANPTDGTTLPEPDPVFAPGSVVDGPNRFKWAAVRNTQLAMSLLVQVPANKTMLGNFPSGSTVKMPDDTAATPNYDESLVPLPLDPWGNPIIFVPAGGLTVTMYKTNTASDSNPEKVVTITSPDGRPFFASAGPDGAFSDDPTNTADDKTDWSSDNIYSFEH